MNTLKMTMLNHAAVEALCSASYLENFLDCLDSLPDDLQRNVSQMRELDVQYNDLLKDIEHYRDNYKKEADAVMKKRTLHQIQRALLKCQELGDEKLQVVSQIIENIENRSRQLEQDLENLDPAANKDIAEPQEKHEKEVKETTPVVVPPVTTPIATHVAAVKAVKEVVDKQERPGHKRQRRQRTHHDSVAKEEEKKTSKDEKDKPKKKKKRKTKKEKEGGQSPTEVPIDPDEPTYCLCEQVSYGEMIGCDNDNCPIEWFHFNCVGLTNKPKGRWYCPKCRGDRPNMKRPDLK
ncbi:inhibitor of growth protein 1-like [Lineus longissimus]|uniref:inhibitor of growth protein 1-like n=1 Tax=Lineus longissimus TaxID=88925 RepID=UPI002B4CED28